MIDNEQVDRLEISNNVPNTFCKHFADNIDKSFRFFISFIIIIILLFANIGLFLYSNDKEYKNKLQVFLLVLSSCFCVYFTGVIIKSYFQMFQRR